MRQGTPQAASQVSLTQVSETDMGKVVGGEGSREKGLRFLQDGAFGKDV